MPADLQALMQQILSRMPVNAPPTLSARGQQVWAGRMKQASTAAATPLAGMSKGGQAQVFADFSKALDSITKTLNKQDQALNASLRGASNFAGSPLAKALGIGQNVSNFVTQAKAQAGSPVAQAQLQAQAQQQAQQQKATGVAALGGAFTNMSTGNLSTAGANLTQSMGAFAALFGKSGKPFQVISKFGELGFGAITKARDLNRATSSADLRLAEMGSGEVAAIMANSQVQRMIFAQRTGSALAPRIAAREASALAAEQAWQPAQITVRGWWESILTQFNRVSAVAGNMLQGMGFAPAVREARMTEQQMLTAGRDVVDRWVERAGGTQWFHTHGRDRRFNEEGE